jgi:hypothetical protein
MLKADPKTCDLPTSVEEIEKALEIIRDITEWLDTIERRLEHVLVVSKKAKL